MARIDDLEGIARKSKKPLPWYGLAMEYRSLGRHEESVTTFQKVHELDAGYVAAYFMCAQVLAETGAVDRAKDELRRGIEAAQKTGDDHALGEMTGLLESL